MPLHFKAINNFNVAVADMGSPRSGAQRMIRFCVSMATCFLRLLKFTADMCGNYSLVEPLSLALYTLLVGMPPSLGQHVLCCYLGPCLSSKLISEY